MKTGRVLCPSWTGVYPRQHPAPPGGPQRWTVHDTANRQRPPDTATQRREKPPVQPGHKGLARGPGDATPLHCRTGDAPGGTGDRKSGPGTGIQAREGTLNTERDAGIKYGNGIYYTYWSILQGRYKRPGM